jgi:hypothetical protein
MGFVTMIQENLEVPFETKVLGVTESVNEVGQNQRGEIVAICQRAGHTQRIPLLELPLPDSRPPVAEWIEAYRLWAGEA